MSRIVLTNMLVVKIATLVSHSVNPDYRELKNKSFTDGDK